MAAQEHAGQGVFVALEYGDDFDVDRINKVAREAQSMFDGMPGLRSKAFTVDEPGRRATNFYVWDSPEQAHAFFSPETTVLIENLYGVSPTITYADVVVLVDNAHDDAAPLS